MCAVLYCVILYQTDAGFAKSAVLRDALRFMFSMASGFLRSDSHDGIKSFHTLCSA